jgi:hypothetical protein
MLNSVIFSLIIIRGSAAIIIILVLWSTLSYPRGSPAAALLLLTESGMQILLCLFVSLKSRMIMQGLGPRLNPSIFASYHHCCPVFK